MKSTVPRAHWPAPSDTSQTTTIQVKPSPKTFTRLTLALLDEYSEQKSRGYNPYDTRSAQPKQDAAWKRKPKRD